MTHDNVRTVLGGSCFGDELSEESLEQLASVSRLVDFPTDHFVFREGEPASSICIIDEGMVSIEIGSPAGRVRLLTLGQGELLGWSPILRHERLTASARTMSPTRAVEIEAAQLLSLFDSDKRLGYDFLRATIAAMAKRLNATLLQLVDIYGASQSIPS